MKCNFPSPELIPSGVIFLLYLKSWLNLNIILASCAYWIPSWTARWAFDAKFTVQSPSASLTPVSHACHLAEPVMFNFWIIISQKKRQKTKKKPTPRYCSRFLRPRKPGNWALEKALLMDMSFNAVHSHTLFTPGFKMGLSWISVVSCYPLPSTGFHYHLRHIR